MFAKRLKILREEFRLSQKQLSEKIKIGNKTISDYEREISSPDIDTLRILADFFQVSTDYLLGKTDDRNPMPLNPSNNMSDIQVAFYNQAGAITDDQAKEVLQFIDFIKNRDANKNH